MKSWRENKILTLVFWVLAPIAAHYTSAYTVGGVVYGINRLGVSTDFLNSAPVFFVQTFVFLSLMYFLLHFSAEKVFGKKITARELGLTPAIDFYDYFWGVVGLVASMVVAGAILALAQYFLPKLDVAQEQTIGMGQIVGMWQYLAAFGSLVVLPAFFEELIYRGLVFSQLRKLKFSKKDGKFKIEIGGWMLATLIVSVFFGLAHGQWNVSIVTFSMSLAMCFIRQNLNDTIWAGVVLHFLKNAIAFFTIYYLPNIPLIFG